MSFVRYISRVYAWLLIVALLLFGASCVNDDIYDACDTGESVAINAVVTPEGQTRTYVEEGTVYEGTYYLYYRILGSSGNYNVAMVDFGDPEGPTTGFAYIMEGDTRKDLKWKNVYDGGKSSQSYYLSNVGPDMFTVNNWSSSYWGIFRFNKEGVDNPFVVAPLDEEYGTNDILSGSITQSSMTGKKLEFTLDHALSLLKINIDVYPSGEDYVDLSNAEVTISNLCTTVGSFSIKNPTIYIYDTKEAPTSDKNGTYRDVDEESPVILVDPSDSEVNCWGGEFDEDAQTGGEAKRRYSTKRFVFPPQTIPPTSGVGRPVLTVRVPRRDALGGQSGGAGEYVTYSGSIPEIMFNDNGIPEDIALKSGYQLNITASIDSPSPELIFAPVRVERWVNKGEHKFKIKQAGIYNAKDFQAIIDLFHLLQNPDLTEDDKERYLAMLEKYGYRDEKDYYVLQLWAPLTLDLNEIEIKGEMEVTGNVPKFAFMFNGYTVTLTSGEGDESTEKRLRGAEGQLELYSIVTGEDRSFAGITTEDNFMDLLKKLKGEDETTLGEMMQYGVLNNFDDTIVFDINASFDLDWEDVYQTLPAKFWGYEILFKVHQGQEVRVRFPEPYENEFIPCGPGEYSPLSRLIPQKTNGIYSSGDFYFLTDCYNKYYPFYKDILKLFGTVSGNTWTFYFRDMVTLEGARTYLSMIPDTSNNKPAYSISIPSSNTVTIEDEWVPASTSTGTEVKSMLSGAGEATGQTSLSTIVSSYNNSSYNRVNYQSLWSFGCFDFDSKKWTFVLNKSGQYVTYTTLFGKMIPDNGSGKYDYEFNLKYYIEVRSVPNNDDLDTNANQYRYFYQDGKDTYAYPNTAADLKRMALGTYWDIDEPDTDPEP